MFLMFLQREWRPAILLLTAWLCMGGIASGDEPDSHGRWAIEPVGGDVAGQPASAFALTGLSATELARLEQLGETVWKKLLAVYVADHADDEQPLFGRHEIEEGRLLFRPRFPLRAGIAYRVIVEPGVLGLSNEIGSGRLELRYELPAPTLKPEAVVEAVYPSAAVLPENQLKFYLHFSHPMSRGESYAHVRLVDGSGNEVAYPFLELGEELWDPSVQRFTLLFDPGRIKRGLRPREEVGPALEEGKTYELIIASAWRDARGQPLKAEYRKRFRVGPPDEQQPSIERWKLHPPAAGTQQPLVVEFDEPLDHAMLHRVLVVVSDAGEPLDGAIQVTNHETRWQFVPSEPWTAGAYRLQVATVLEDLAGNSLERPFEVDIQRTVERRVEERTIELPFQIE